MEKLENYVLEFNDEGDNNQKPSTEMLESMPALVSLTFEADCDPEVILALTRGVAFQQLQHLKLFKYEILLPGGTAY